MCTVILGTRVFEQAPVFVASNRDENLDRPAEGPSIRTSGTLRVLAPTDLQEGGTWLGVNERGVLAALTNRFGSPRNDALRSRGEVVMKALAHTSAKAAAEAIAALGPQHYNPFHLITADQTAAYVVWSDGTDMHFVTLEPGLHVVTERSFGAAESGRETLLAQRLSNFTPDHERAFEDFRELLSIRVDGSMDGTDIRVDDWNYGTRSSAILEIGESSWLRYATGAPHEAAYEDLSALLASVLA